MGNPPGSENGTAADGYPPKSHKGWTNPVTSSDGGHHDDLVGEQKSAVKCPLVSIVLVLAITEICIIIVCLVWVLIRKCQEQSDEGTTSESSPA